MKNNEAIKIGRKALGWNQQRLADFLGVSLSIVGKWEREERKAPDHVVLLLLLVKKLEPEDFWTTDPDRFRRFVASHLSNHTK